MFTTIAGVPHQHWSRRHSNGVVMTVSQPSEAAAFVLDMSPRLEDVRWHSPVHLDDALRVADEYVRHRGHRCTMKCGEWESAET